MAVNKSSALVRWLSLGVLLLSIAVAGVILSSDDPETATITEFPAELSRMFSALSE